MTLGFEYIQPSWSAPKNVIAVTTTRVGGFSRGSYESFNLGDHVGDEHDAVKRNRALLCETLSLASEPRWLNQVHGVNVIHAAETTPDVIEADGAWTDRRGTVLAVLTADCLPVFLCDRSGSKVALLHAGWRGLAAGIIEAGVRALALPGAELLAWFGPGIGPKAYEVGAEVRQTFIDHDAGADGAFRPSLNGRWLADIYMLASRRLHGLSVTQITGGHHCTYSESDQFFSYRRDGQCGRMASLIWMT